MRDNVHTSGNEPQFSLESIDALTPEERQTLSLTRLITMALLLGAALFLMVVALNVSQQAANTPAGTSSGTTAGQAQLSTVVILQLGWSTAMLVFVMGYPVIRNAALRQLTTQMSDESVDEREDNAKIARGYMVATVIAASLAEGLSILGTVILLQSGRMFNIVLAAVPLLAFMLLIPTTGRLLKFRQNVKERRTLSLGP